MFSPLFGIHLVMRMFIGLLFLINFEPAFVTSDSVWHECLSAAQVGRWRTSARWSETSRERPKHFSNVFSFACRSNRHILKAQPELVPITDCFSFVFFKGREATV